MGEMIAGMLICVGIFLIVMLVVYILFLLTLQNTMNSVHPDNRTMAPGLVWLLLVPILNIFWMFFVVLKISESLANEYRDRGLNTRGDSFGKTMGLIVAGLSIATIALSGVSGALRGNDLDVAGPGMIVGLLSNFLSLVQLVCWIVYWVQIAGYGSTLRNSREDRPSRGYEFDNYERKRRRRERGSSRDGDYDDEDENEDDDDGWGSRKPRTSY
ncbi:MAG: hypothetical protein R3B84_14830 [Zavarzinella sp.]